MRPRLQLLKVFAAASFKPWTAAQALIRRYLRVQVQVLGLGFTSLGIRCYRCGVMILFRP